MTTTNASNTISATSDFSVAITVNDEQQENSKSYAWHDGENIVLITVDGGLTYTVTVTKQ